MDYNNLIILYSEILNEKYKNVDVDKLANIYFGGKVISRNIFFKDGTKKH